MCCAGGDRTTRHHQLRNAVHRFAAGAGLHPELEKPGLLVATLPEEEAQAERRPADVYLPTWAHGTPAALDFAVTAPQRQEYLREASLEALAAAGKYSAHKRDYKGTEAACRDQGIAFLPMVAEASGAWAPEALKVLRQMAAAAAARRGTTTGAELARALECTSVCVRRAHARAVLKRRGEPQGTAVSAQQEAGAVLAAAAA